MGSDNYTFSSRVTPAWDDNAGFEAQLERIITQKWIANYPDGPEGWSEYRRTGYPEVIPVVRNSSNGTIDTQLQVRRLPYTRDEKINNASGVASGKMCIRDRNGYAQRTHVAISMNNVSVEQVLNKIEEASDYVFLYNDKTIQKNRIVSVRNKSGKILDILCLLYTSRCV